MCYNIEISFDILKFHNVFSLKNMIGSLALDYNCINYYYDYDMEEINKFTKNRCIIVVIFDKNNILNCAKFIKVIKRMKEVHIETVYENDFDCKILYASYYYLKKIDKNKMAVYNKFKRERRYTDNELMILNIIDKHQNRSNSF